MLVLEDFFINFCILCTGIFLIHHYFLRDHLSNKLIRCKSLRGICHGIFGVVLMHFGIQLNDGVLIDLRSIPMMLAAFVGGWVPTFTATAIIIVFRLVLYPITFSSLNNIYVLGFSAIIFTLICNSRMSAKRKWVLMPLSFIIILASTFYIVIPEFETAIIIFVQYASAIAFASFGAYIIKSYLSRNDENYEKVKLASKKDHLTGLNNVRSFDQAIGSFFSSAKAQEIDLSLLVIDIDHFKQINDTYGHPAGDKVIKKVAQLLLLSCRSVDFVSRNGGEEFSIIMPDCDTDSCQVIAERIRKAVDKSTSRISEVELQVSVSIGYATAVQDNIVSVADLIDKADQGLYKAKQRGRNRVVAGL
ncbi:diguanylate cyclase [Peribacillus glennii]|uniref:GGDEF domain-containing protein n=1 Tax=Peribacillus glennii TaxID=2303991 RepID=A0A372L908_9BACI|nr:diguanylate cyclase [Peribacillus glennii]RFU61995.1 GGDEF domain-containing protein [Peribacillus glennii]